MSDNIKIIADRQDIVAIADAVRNKIGTTQEMTLEGIASSINRMSSSGGVDLPDLAEPATEDEVFLNQEYIDENGEKKTGTFTIENELSTQDDLIAQIQIALEGKAAGGGASGGTDDAFDRFIEGQLTELNSNAISVIDNRFMSEYGLETVNLPQAEYICPYAFASCDNLKTVNIPRVKSIDSNAFAWCPLYMLDCPMLEHIWGSAFHTMQKLQALVLRNTSIVAFLEHISAFDDTPISNGNGYIYVPRSMIDAYISATNWSAFEDQFRVLEDYTVDGTINGELDVEFEEGIHVYLADMEGGEMIETGIIINTSPDMSWSEWFNSSYRDDSVLWTITDDGYIVCNDDAYYVFNPIDGSLVTADMPVRYLGEDNIVILVHQDYVQDLL